MNCRCAAPVLLAAAGLLALLPWPARGQTGAEGAAAAAGQSLAPTPRDAEAMVKLGDQAFLGQRVPQDDGRALAWYRKAAEAGNANAMFNLGVLYGKDRGVARDDATSREWLQKAAEAGSATAKQALARLQASSASR